MTDETSLDRLNAALAVEDGAGTVELSTEDAQDILERLDRMARRQIGATQMIQEAAGELQARALDAAAEVFTGDYVGVAITLRDRARLARQGQLS